MFCEETERRFPSTKQRNLHLILTSFSFQSLYGPCDSCQWAVLDRKKTWSVIYRRISSAEKRCVWLVKVGSVRGRLMLAQTMLLYMNWLHTHIYIYIFQLTLCLFFTSDKEAFCPALNSSLASANASLLACEIECCFGNNCNNLNFPGRYMTWAYRPTYEGGLRNR